MKKINVSHGADLADHGTKADDRLHQGAELVPYRTFYDFVADKRTLGAFFGGEQEVGSFAQDDADFLNIDEAGGELLRPHHSLDLDLDFTQGVHAMKDIMPSMET